MEGTLHSRKRPFSEHDDLHDNSSINKRVRFPKGKKIKPTEELVCSDGIQRSQNEWNTDPRSAAKERAKRRSSMTTEICIDEEKGNTQNISTAEVEYEDNENFYEDGIQMEPFNLEKEREEGYFDAAGNFVEYYADDNNHFKDAWLDNVGDDSRLFSGRRAVVSRDVDGDDTSPAAADLDIAEMKRNIADILDPGETVLEGLKRLKGGSKMKEKMGAREKQLFDQLTEAAMKLMDNGHYDVYHQRRDDFERQARRSLDMFADGGDHHDDDDDSAAANQADYVYDEPTGYYYSSTSGYYYDPQSSLYCCASTGKWYRYDLETSSYSEAAA